MNKQLQLLIILFFLPMSGSVLFAQSFLFANRVGGAQFENAMGIAVDHSSNIVISGYFAGTADFDPDTASAVNISSNGSNDVFVAKYDSTGSFLWAIAIGGPNDELMYSDPVVDLFNNVYVCGVFNDGCDFNPAAQNFQLNNYGSNDGFIAKYDSMGNFIWAKGFGGMLEDDVYRIDVDNNGEVLFIGSFKDTVDLNPGTAVLSFTSAGGADVFYGKLDATGSLVFVNAMRGKGDDRAYNITHDLNNEIVLTAGFNDTIVVNPNGTSLTLTDPSGASSLVAKFSSLGSLQWAFRISKCLPFGLSTDHNNDILTSGQFNGSADFDPGTNVQTLSAQAGSFDAYMAKYTQQGNFVFASRFGGNQLDCAYAIHETADSTIILSGFFNLTADFDPSLTIASLTSAGSGDVFVGTYSQNGAYLNAFRCGNAGFDFVRNFITDQNGNFYIAGGFDQTVDFNPASPIFNLTSAGSRDGFFAKYGGTLTGLKEVKSLPYNFIVYPSPVGNMLHILFSVKGLTESARITVLNLEGQKLSSCIINSSNATVDVSQLNSGVYILTLQDRERIYTQKFVKQ